MSIAHLYFKNATHESWQVIRQTMTLKKTDLDLLKWKFLYESEILFTFKLLSETYI